VNDTPLKQLLQEMSLDGIEGVIEIIEQRPDVKKVILVTQESYDEASVHFKNVIERVPDESA
jgi:hypothetical protein